MKEIILITGNSGLLANETIKLLSKDYQIRTLTTNFSNVNNNTVFYWNIDKNFLDDAALKDCKHIVHLAGYSILKPWTKRNKKRMYNSRIGGSKLLFNKCQELNIKPDTFITASAMGIYGIYATGTKSENSTIAKDWVAQMAKDWEDAADNFKKLHTKSSVN